MFIPTIITGGREAPTALLGLEAKSLKNGMTHHWISRTQTNHTFTIALFRSNCTIALGLQSFWPSNLKDPKQFVFARLRVINLNDLSLTAGKF